MAQENSALIHRWFEEVWNKGRMEAIDEMASPDAVGHGQAQHDTDIGLKEFRTFAVGLRTAFPGDYLKSGIAYAFHPHRDTWYSAPFCQINWWMPVYAIGSENCMAIHPRYWTQPLRNSSSGCARAEAFAITPTSTRWRPSSTPSWGCCWSSSPPRSSSTSPTRSPTRSTSRIASRSNGQTG